MAPPLPEASQPSKTTHSGGPISPGPICPPSSSRRCTSRSCTAASSFFSWALDSRSVRSTSSSRLMRRGCRNWASFASPPVPRPGQWDDGAVMTALPLVFDAPRRGKPPRHLADLTREEARAAVTELGQPGFRADQLARHFYRGVSEPAQMTDLPAAVREDLAQALLPGLLTPVRHLSADGGRTRKTLWRLHDGALVESVLMRYPDRATVCISSQAGCGMACPFCATGQGGLTRNLSAAEIIGQAGAAAAAMANGEIPGGPGRLSNVVFMGMGEPLANYARVRKTLDALLTPAPHGLGLSQRAVTVSTVGLVPGIRRLTDEGLNVTLAVSLHAPDDELRDTLVPINTRWKVGEVLEAADDYARRTGPPGGAPPPPQPPPGGGGGGCAGRPTPPPAAPAAGTRSSTR